VGEPGAEGVQPPRTETGTGGAPDTGGGAADVEGTTQKRPVTKEELDTLTKRLDEARKAVSRATTPEQVAAAQQKFEEARNAYVNAEGPPTRGTYLRGGPSDADYQAQLDAHQARVDARVHAEGGEPTPEPKQAGKIFSIGGSKDQSVVRGTDSQGNTWVGNGYTLIKGDTLIRAANQALKRSTTTERTVPEGAVGKVVTPDPQGAYQGVTWERQVTTPDGKVMVIGTKPDGTHVGLQKQIYDALHAAAGPDGTIVADTRTGKSADDRMFARNAQGETTGVGMPMRVDQNQARIWARGPETPTEPAARGARAPEVLADQGLTTEPDHVVPNQFVAKDQTGKVVGKGPSPEEALADARDQAGTSEEPGTTGPQAPDLFDRQVPGEAPAEPIAPALPEPESQLGRLLKTRNALEAKGAGARTLDDSLRLARVNRQIARLQRAQGMVPTSAQERRGGIVEPFRAPQVGRPKDFLDYKFNNGVSVYRSVFEEAGHNPDTATNQRIEWQNKVLSDHMQNKFGFKNVEVAGARGRDPTPVDHFIARNAMLDMTRAMADSMAAMGLPHDAASLGGELSLRIVPEGGRRDYGVYYPRTGVIEIMSRANSFGHEWTHAWDHILSQRLTGNPTRMNDLLTRYGRGGLLRPNDPVEAAMAKIINTMFYDDAALAARRLGLETDAQKVDRAGNPTKAALEAQRQLDLLNRGGSKLRIDASEFRKQSALFKPSKAGYYASVYEMLARAHEAYIAWKMESAGVDPRGVVMPDEAYIKDTDRILHMIYPKQGDRDAIFQAFDDLHRALRNDQVLSGGQPAGEFANYGISDPPHYPVTAPVVSGTAVGRVLKGEIAKLKTLTKSLSQNALSDKNRPSPGYLTRGVRAADYFRAATYSAHGMMETIIARSPDAAKPLMRKVMDQLAGAPGEGRYTGEFFEEAVRGRARVWMNRFANIMQASDIDPENITPKLDAMMRHVMVTGETRYQGEAVPANVITAAGRLRNLMDQLWQTSHNAGLDVGYASRYYPRLYDMHRFFADPQGFRVRATELYRLMFDREMGVAGSNPQKLLEKWRSLSKTDRNLAPDPNLATRMTELNKNLRRQREIEANPNPTMAEQTELARLKREANQLAIDAHDPLGDHVASINADNWHGRMMKGGHADFDTIGPSGKYLNARTLPPEADTIMAPFMHTETADAIPNYIHAVARRTAYAERFGPQGEVLDQAYDALANVPGIRGEDIRRFRSLVDMTTGRADNHLGFMKDLQNITNVVHALGSLALMPRAVWSSLAEPMNAALVTGDARAGFKIFASQFGQLFRSVSAAERTELANFLGVTTSSMHDSIMLSRMSADYSDSPRLNRLMSQYYRITGLTQLTNAQRIGAANMSHWFLGKLARAYASTGTSTKDINARDNATRWFRELGLNDPVHADFAKFINDLGPNAPSIDLLQKHDMGSAYGLAVRRMTDRVIQDPYKVDRATASNIPVLGLIYQLMSFNYQFQRNVLNPLWGNVEHSFGRAKLAAEAGGAGKLAATASGALAGGGSAVHAASMAATVLGVGLMTTALRQLLFAPDQWDQHEKDGTLGSYLTGLTFQRSGLNGTLDPILQVFTNLRYNAELTSLLDGASMNWFAKNAQDVIQPFVTSNDSPNTNTRLFNQARGAFNLVGVPLAATGLTMLGAAGGPLTRIAAGAALMYGTSPGTASGFAGLLTGEKGTELPKTGPGGLTKLQGLDSGLAPLTKLGAEADAPGAGGGAGGVIPWGLMDDVAVPTWRYLGPVLNNLPGPVKAAALGVGGLTAGYNYLSETAPYRNAPPPKPKKEMRQ